MQTKYFQQPFAPSADVMVFLLSIEKRK